MKKEKWVREQMNRLRDNRLRGHVDQLCQAIVSKSKSKVTETDYTRKLENKLILRSEKVIDRYKEIIMVSVVKDKIKDEHKNIQELIRHLLDEAYEKIPGHHDVRHKLEGIMSRFETVANKYAQRPIFLEKLPGSGLVLNLPKSPEELL